MGKITNFKKFSTNLPEIRINDGWQKKTFIMDR